MSTSTAQTAAVAGSLALTPKSVTPETASRVIPAQYAAEINVDTFRAKTVIAAAASTAATATFNAAPASASSTSRATD